MDVENRGDFCNQFLEDLNVNEESELNVEWFKMKLLPKTL